jgi:hypothetical protein
MGFFEHACRIVSPDPIAPLECGLCCEPCFADDWCEAVGEFVCEACVEDALNDYQPEPKL